MTTQELNTMVLAMRTRYNLVETRMDVTDPLYYLSKGLHAIGRNELAAELMDLCYEINNIETREIVKIGTFREK